MKIYRDSNGEVVHIGDWNEREPTGKQRPIPEGWVEDTADVVSDAQGGLVVKENYRALRRAEYPSIPDQLDMQYADARDGTTTWVETITAVKTRHPKPGG